MPDETVPFELAARPAAAATGPRGCATVRGIEPAAAQRSRDAAKHRAFAKAKAIVAVRNQTRHLARSGSQTAAKRVAAEEAAAARAREATRRNVQARAAAEELLQKSTRPHVRSEARARFGRVEELLKEAGEMPLTRPKPPPPPPTPQDLTLHHLATQDLTRWPTPAETELSSSSDEELAPEELDAIQGKLLAKGVARGSGRWKNAIEEAQSLSRAERERVAEAKEQEQAEAGTVAAAVDELVEELAENRGGAGLEAEHYTRQFLLIEAAADRRRRRRRAEAGETKPRPPKLTPAESIAEVAAAKRRAAAEAKSRPMRVDFLTGKRVPVPQSKLEPPLRCGAVQPQPLGKLQRRSTAVADEAEAKELAQRAEKAFANGDTKEATALWEQYLAASEDSAATRAAKATANPPAGAHLDEPASANLWALLRGRIADGMPLPPFEPPPPPAPWYPYRVRLADERIAQERGVPLGELMAKDGPRDPDNLEPEPPPPKLTEEEVAAAEAEAAASAAQAAREEAALLQEQLAAAEKHRQSLITASLGGAATRQVSQLRDDLDATNAENAALAAKLAALQRADDDAFRQDQDVLWAAMLRAGEEPPQGFEGVLGDHEEVETDLPPRPAPQQERAQEPEPEPWIYKEVVAEDVAVEDPRWDVQETLLRVESEEQQPPVLASGQPPPLQQLAARGPEAWGDVEDRMMGDGGEGDTGQQARENAALLQELAAVDAELARRAAADDPRASAQGDDDG